VAKIGCMTDYINKDGSNPKLAHFHQLIMKREKEEGKAILA
jgi:hypothetical protein